MARVEYDPRVVALLERLGSDLTVGDFARLAVACADQAGLSSRGQTRLAIDLDLSAVHPTPTPAAIPVPTPMDTPMTWEIVVTAGITARPIVRRANVPGGWLYQVEHVEKLDPGRVGDPTLAVFGWHPPVFVPGGAS